jgi:hypothetical protein
VLWTPAEWLTLPRLGQSAIGGPRCHAHFWLTFWLTFWYTVVTAVVIPAPRMICICSIEEELWRR